MIILKTLFGGSLELPQKEFIAEAEKAIEGCRQTDAACLPVSGTACLEYIGGLLAQYMGMLESRRIEGRKLRGILRNIAAVSAHSLSTLEGTEPGEVWDSLKSLLEKKNADYGSSVLKNGCFAGNCIRMSDKLSRLQSLAQKAGQAQNFEPAADTWADLAGYAVLGLAILSAAEAQRR